MRTEDINEIARLMEWGEVMNSLILKLHDVMSERCTFEQLDARQGRARETLEEMLRISKLKGSTSFSSDAIFADEHALDIELLQDALKQLNDLQQSSGKEAFDSLVTVLDKIAHILHAQAYILDKKPPEDWMFID